MATPVYKDTPVGKLWIDPAAPFTVSGTGSTIAISFDRTDLPRDVVAADVIWKYYSTDNQVDLQYTNLEFDMQIGDTGSDWTSVKKFSREIGRDTMPPSYQSPIPTGVQGTFTFPLNGRDYRRVLLRTYSDSSATFTLGVGISNDHFYRDTPQGVGII